ncbi:hypothetical protein N9L71_09070 [Verrucomicrobiales bacterium]|nr:hypothetical protein [Verrucomicrobiales bacterium]
MSADNILFLPGRSRFSCILSVAVLLLFSHLTDAITLTGANGRKVNFAGIKEARKGGIMVQMEPDGDLIPIRWEKLDLTALKDENALVYSAYGDSCSNDEMAFTATGLSLLFPSSHPCSGI